MKIPHRNSFEKGQAIVLIAALMIGMIAMVGLAVDGGRLFFQDRNNQNDVDHAIVAGGYAMCTLSNDASIQFAIEDAFRASGVEFDENTSYSYTVSQGTYLTSEYVLEVILNDSDIPYFIQIVNENAALNTMNDASFACTPFVINPNGAALFAMGCDLDISGSLIEIDGDLLCNEGCDVTGGQATINGYGAYVTNSNTDTPGINWNPSANNPFPTSTMPEIRRYYTAQFDGYVDQASGASIGTGDISIAATAEGMYHYHQGNWRPTGPGPHMIEPGLHFINGDVNLSNVIFTGKTSIAATGSVNLSLSDFSNEAYVNSEDYGPMFIYSAEVAGNCGRFTVNLSGSNATTTGSIEAYDGNVFFSHASSFSFGPIYAQGIRLHGDNIYINRGDDEHAIVRGPSGIAE